MPSTILASELKPLSWFQHSNGGSAMIRLNLEVLGDTCWYVVKDHDGYCLHRIPSRYHVEPLPDCTGFDWVPPEEPTALELAKEIRKAWVGYQSVADDIDAIIEALEREALERETAE